MFTQRAGRTGATMRPAVWHAWPVASQLANREHSWSIAFWWPSKSGDAKHICVVRRASAQFFATFITRSVAEHAAG